MTNKTWEFLIVKNVPYFNMRNAENRRISHSAYLLQVKLRLELCYSTFREQYSTNHLCVSTHTCQLCDSTCSSCLFFQNSFFLILIISWNCIPLFSAEPPALLWIDLVSIPLASLCPYCLLLILILWKTCNVSCALDYLKLNRFLLILFIL